MPWFFIFDHHNYARWSSVHIEDLEKLPFTAPDVHKDFEDGKFVVRKTSNPFSAIGIDQAHGQDNAYVKANGGAIGLTKDPVALRKWMLSGPGVQRLLTEFRADDGEE